MRKFFPITISLILFITAIQSCNQANQDQTLESEWLGKSPQEMINTAEEQFQGFSRSMVEIGYRYQELYWSGADQNWEYAEYQREHIEEALVQGLVRRPERAQSSGQFLTFVLPHMEEVIEREDADAFSEAFNLMTVQCNTCHQMERVEFMRVKAPEVRTSIIHR